MKNVSAHSATSPAIWLVNPFTDWKANLVSAIQNGTRALFVCAALIVVLAFALPLAAQAQNNSANPYINSTHRYRVAKGADDNTVSWSLQNPSGTDVPIDSWATSGVTVKAAADSAYIDITFDKTVFAAPSGEWTLIYSEESALTGACVARRSMAITPVDNTFYFSMGADAESCHPREGDVLNWNDVDVEEPVVPLKFTVQLHKTGNYKINSYTFEGKISFTDGEYSLVGIDVTGATVNVNTTTGDFDVTLTNAPFDASNAGAITPFTIEMNVQVSGLVYVGDDVKVALTGGSAISGTNYTVVTDVVDPPPDGTDQVQQLTILPLPATTNIAILD